MDSTQMDILEECANRVVLSIEKTISAIKNVDAFAPTNRKRPPLGQVALASMLESQGMIKTVKETVDYVEENIETNIRFPNAEEVFDERSKVVYLILLPLLEALLKCYQLIDDIPQPAPPPPLSTRKKDKKPPPPRGMLSIQNYTDIAAFLEFTVCVSILPCLDANVLTPVRDRAQYLIPKSLAGRLSRVSLLWGGAVAEMVGKAGEPAAVIVKEKELRRAVEILGSLVLLDRFRPMLLPRHLADLYAGTFQAEALRESSKQKNDVVELDAVSRRLIPDGITPGAVDSFSQARALQALLLRGTKAPLWLRKRASSLLTNLASRDMAAIVQVFVTSASSSQEDMTSAALRLVKALVAVQDTDEDYYSKICRQLVQLLDLNVERMNASNFAGALTVWAFLDQLPRIKLFRNFLPVLAETVFPGDAPSDSPHRMVRRVMALSSVIPSAHNAPPFCEMLLAPIPTREGMNLLGQLVRIASMVTLEGDVGIKVDTNVTLRMVCSIMGRTTFTFNGAEVQGSDLLSVALLHAIAPNQWDMEGRRYQISLGGDIKAGSKLTYVNEEQIHMNDSVIIGDIEKRGALVVTEVIAFLGGKEGSGTEVKDHSNLPQSFFRHLLLTIFAISQGRGTTSFSPSLRLVVMVVLPVLCERLPPEVLLLGPSSDASGILATFKILFDCAAASIDDAFSQSQDANSSAIVIGFDNAKSKFLNVMLTIQDNRIQQLEIGDDGIEDTLMSAASISLSLLTAMLELGSDQRNQQERTLLESTLPPLLALSSFVTKSRTRGYEVEKSHAEMAEMASHAAVLIVSKSAAMEHGVAAAKNEETSVPILIKEAANEIKSEHPAVRARGAVRLRHLVRGYLVERGEQLASKAMIVEVSEPSLAASEDEVLNEILGIAMLTLADDESYVYLAGIQTIVAIADVHPQLFITKIALGVCTGKVSLDAQSKNVSQLAQDERIKLSEALLFIVRRRGAAIDRYVSKLVAILIYGYQTGSKGQEPVDATLIQEETHSYFTKDSNAVNELTSPTESLDAKSIRVSTGGPIFKSELNEVLRSSCIAVLAEIVSVAQPSSVAPYANELVHFVSNAMHLNVPRLVRRAAALLGVSLYDASLREVEETSTTKLTVALVVANEKAMKSSLEGSIGPVSFSSNLFDPATSTRSQEAMDVRKQLEDAGALVAAALHLETQKREDEDPLVSIVKRRLREGRDEKEGSLMIHMTSDTEMSESLFILQQR